MNPSYVFLAAAIVAEVIGTTALKASEQLTRPVPTIITIAGIGLAFFLLSYAIRVIPIGIAYAVWSGAGIILITLSAAVVYRQIPDVAAVLGIAMIIGGVLVIHLYSKSFGH
ncbi:MAG: multidrug efflux SMR transporter [Gammaproteobacteria bacterium]|nr:multidrug efflux SMR transporter [Gammaproteobacteria bacterium]